MRVGICSLGCRVNIYESEFVEALLKNHGYEIVDFSDCADIYIINTCSVTNEADKKSRKMINSCKKKNKDAIVVVMGCFSQVKSDSISADIVIGNKDKSKIIELLDEFISNNNKIKKIYNLRDDISFEEMILPGTFNHTRAFVKIEDGCNQFCSYCIIPYTRGSIRSKDFDDVIREVEELVKNGYKEIVLTGIHTGKYGIDKKDVNLEMLLRRLVLISNIYRIRLSSIEINEISDGIIDLMKNNKIIARHLHIPLQSGSDKILKAMNRKYDKAYFKERIDKIRSIDSDISITTDLIVGFPGEGEEEFNETLEFLKEIKFTKIHTFPYSKRDGTPAAVMKDQVDGKIKKERVRKVLSLSDEYELEFYCKYIGKTLNGVSEVNRDGSILVHSSNFIPICVNDKIDNNMIVDVTIEDVIDGKVIGKIIKG